MNFSRNTSILTNNTFTLGLRNSFSVVALIFIHQFSIAQIVENFSDGDITSTPAWTGNLENFTVVAGTLELSDTDPLLTQSYITTSNIFPDLDNKEWRIDISQNFSGSDANQSRIYLTSDADVISYTANNSAGVEGYYLKLGEALSNDVIRFYKDDGITVTLLASGNTNISTSFDISLKVTRDDQANWVVAVDADGGNNYSTEMTFTDNSLNSSLYYGIVCSYTSSNADGFSFDNIYAGDIAIDNIPPSILSINAISESELDVTFDESVDLTTSQTNSNYFVSGIGFASTATRDAIDFSVVHLDFSTSFTSNQTYTLEITGISDLSGNAMPVLQSSDFNWIQATVAEFRDVVFSEILADPTPTVGLPESEFVEILNTSATSTFNLENWKFVNSTTEKILPLHILGPGEFVILCDQTNASLFSTFGPVIGIPSFSALSNTGDSLSLLNSADELIDVVVYSDQWFMSEDKQDGGWTLELINPFQPCQTSGNWSESSDENGGTPGAVNSVYDPSPDTIPPVITSVQFIDNSFIRISFSESMDTTGYTISGWDVLPFNMALGGIWNSALDIVTMQMQFPVSAPNTYTLVMSGISDCSGNIINPVNIDITIGFTPVIGDVVINEIMADPDPVIGLPNAEYIELRNNTSTLLDLSTIKLNSGYFTNQVLIAPDNFIIITDEDNISLFTGLNNVYGMVSFPGLTNSGMALELTMSDGTIMETLTYSEEWYDDLNKADGGWALERINPLAICSGSYNWKASMNESGGTAGFENSIYNTGQNGAPVAYNHGALSIEQIYIRFSESMDINSLAEVDLTLSPGNMASAPVWNSDKELLILNVFEPLIQEQLYSLDISGLKDCDGNQAFPSNLDFMIGVDPSEGDLLINEIMADAISDSQIASPPVDFIEIYNTTTHYIELTRLLVNDAYFTKQVIIEPDSFLILMDDENSPVLLLSYPNIRAMADFPALTEDGTNITLTLDNNTIDQISYNKTYYNDVTKESGGYSLERINPNDPCNSSDNWHASIDSDGSTAGTINSVHNTTPDTTPPVILFVLSEPEESVTLVFNEPISDASLASINWIVDGEAQDNFNPYITGEESNHLVLQYGEMEPEIIYTFILSGLTDCWNNIAEDITGKFAIGETPAPTDVVINEILYNPFEGGEDFIEIYNRSQKAISLKNWTIADATNNEMNAGDILITSNLLLLPGEFLVLTQNAKQISDFYIGTQSNRILIIEGLADFSSDDKVYLLMSDGNICDEVAYNESMHYPLLNNTDGISLERISYDRDSDDLTNWHSASAYAGFATPGYLNSQSSELTSDDDSFSMDNEIFSPDNDGYKDVVTFSYNIEGPGYTGDINIYDSAGRLVRQLMSGELLGISGSISWDGFTDDRLKAPIGIYVIYFEAFSVDGNVIKSKRACVLAHSLN